MRPIEKLLELTGDKDAVEAVDAVVSSIATGLFAAQTIGLVGFPAGTLTIGEIESKLRFVVEATAQKLIEKREELLG